MFPYHSLQDLVDQAVHTEGKIWQEGRGRPYGRASQIESASAQISLELSPKSIPGYRIHMECEYNI